MGGILSAMAGWTAGERTHEELSRFLGICSNLDAFETTALIAPPLDTLRLDLIRLALGCGESLDGSRREAPKLRLSPIMSLRVASGSVLFSLAQRTLAFSDVVADGLRQLDAFAMLAEQVTEGERDVMCRDDGKFRTWSPGSDELLIRNMTVAVFGLAAVNELNCLPLAQWRTDGAAHPQGGRVVQLVDHLEGLFATGAIKPWPTVLECQSTDWSHHAASALAATLLEKLAPNALLVTQALWVHYLQRPYLAPLVAQDLECLVSQQWRNVIEMAASIGTPITVASPLVAALDGPGEGWSKVRMVLQSVLFYMPLNFDDNARMTIERMEP